MTSAVPITGRPSGWSPKTASEKRSCTSSCGVSSYIAISSSTTSRLLVDLSERGSEDHVGHDLERSFDVVVGTRA
jgi:hypothetical protein